MADKTLLDLLSEAPVNTALDGSEPLETVVSSASKGATIRQLSFLAQREDTTTAGLLLTEDQGKVVSMNNASANTFTIQLEATEPFPISGTMILRQTGTGATTLDFAVGVTILQKASNSLQISEKFGQVVLHKVSADTWHVAGEFLAV